MGPITVPILEVGEESPQPDEVTPSPAPIEIDLTPPTPSPLFPRDVKSLMRLNHEQAKSLVREYGLEPLQIPVASPFADRFGPNNEPQSSREDDLNRFMSHIGVRLTV